MSIDKWGSDSDYVEKVKEEYGKIDKELENEKMSTPLPEELTKEMTEQLFKEKEEAIKSVYSQLAYMMKQGS